MPYVVSSWMVTVLAVFSVGITLVVVRCAEPAHRAIRARYFLAAWALLLVGVVTLFLHNTGVLPSNALHGQLAADRVGAGNGGAVVCAGRPHQRHAARKGTGAGAHHGRARHGARR
jgi:hypothetical protein